MSHALATVLHRGRKAASNIMAACILAGSELKNGPHAAEVPDQQGGGGWKIRNPKSEIRNSTRGH
jgi:hypothetical protein